MSSVITWPDITLRLALAIAAGGNDWPEPRRARPPAGFAPLARVPGRGDHP